MTDRMALLESALDSLPDGLALLDLEGGVIFWNEAAEAITGYSSTDLLASAVPDALRPLLNARRDANSPAGRRSDRGTVVRARHKLGHDLPVIARTLLLCDALGDSLGAATLFHPAERLDALPHGDCAGDRDAEESQADLEERLQAAFEDSERSGQPFGVLWIAVDQGPELRKTHGAAACRAMAEKIRRAISGGLRPADELGRWSDDEFLVMAHERTPEMLAAHARTLAGLARTADFRWWGDRLSLTVSVGAAQAYPGESLPWMLIRAREATRASIREGGNRVTVAQRTIEEMEPGHDSGRNSGVKA